MDIKDNTGTREASHPINVLMLCRSASYQGLGGPVWSIRALLKEQERHPSPDFVLRGVLCDGVFSSYSELAESTLTAPRRRLLPPSISYVRQAAMSIPNLLRNIGKAVPAKQTPILHCHDFI